MRRVTRGKLDAMPRVRERGGMSVIWSWERRGDCTRDHRGDSPICWAGGTDALGRSHIERTYDDGCVLITDDYLPKAANDPVCGKGQ